jgi:hypothetical protein
MAACLALGGKSDADLYSALALADYLLGSTHVYRSLILMVYILYSTGVLSTSSESLH